VDGLVGGGFVALLSYAYYHYSGASTVVNTAYSAKKKFEDALKKAWRECQTQMRRYNS
jgi:hypothetical protein